MVQDNGGPASGMTLLDYFAGHAYTGILSGMRVFDEAALERAADEAYLAASSLLIARDNRAEVTLHEQQACAHTVIERDERTDWEWCANCGVTVTAGRLSELSVRDIQGAIRKTGECPHGTAAFDVLCCRTCAPILEADNARRREEANIDEA